MNLIERVLKLHSEEVSERNIAKQIKISRTKVREILLANRARQAVKSELKPPDVEFLIEEIFADLEDGEDESLEDIILPEGRTLVLSDIHLPYHHKPALMTAIAAGRKAEVNTVYLNGDIIDCYQLSKHERRPGKRSVKEELEITRQFLSMIRAAFPNAEIYYKFGNHETRHARYLLQNAPELFNLEEISLETLLKLHEYGIHYVEDIQFARAGSLYIAHGHESNAVIAGGVYAARNTRIKSGNTSMIYGHIHKTKYDPGRSPFSGKVSQVFTTGCLCKLNPRWLPKNDWNWGHAIIETSGDAFEVQNKLIE